MRMLDQLRYRRSWWAARKMLSWKFTSSWAATCSVIFRFMPARQFGQGLLERLQVGVVPAADGQPHGQFLDHRAEAVHLAEVFHRELHDRGPAVTRQRDQAFPLQNEEGVPHRTPADVERFGDLLLAQVLAG